MKYTYRSIIVSAPLNIIDNQCRLGHISNLLCYKERAVLVNVALTSVAGQWPCSLHCFPPTLGCPRKIFDPARKNL